MLLTKTTVAKIIVYTSLAINLLAVTQPCFDTTQGPGESGEGIAILISGFFGFFSSLTALVWLANPALWLSWGYWVKKPQSSLLASATAVLIALLFLGCNEIMINEAGGTATITSYRIGYWLWLLSMLIMLAGNLYFRIIKTVGQIHDQPKDAGTHLNKN